MADIKKSQFYGKEFLPQCVNCLKYTPAEDGDPFSSDARCEEFQNPPDKYLLMNDSCSAIHIDISAREFQDIGDRPPTMYERWALDR